MKLVDGERYLVKIKIGNNYYYKLKYWFDKRVTKYWTYKAGFYETEYRYSPCETIVEFININNFPKFTKWKIEEPIEGERYLVYRVGNTRWYSPHYTIRKYHNGSFGSKDVKYWIKLSEVWK